MDPTVALEALRRLVNRLEEELPGPDVLDTTPVEDLASELIDVFGGLDDWLTRGGFPPSAWKPKDGRVALTDAQREDLNDALDDAYTYRLGGAHGPDDPSLDANDAASLPRYQALADLFGMTLS